MLHVKIGESPMAMPEQFAAVRDVDLRGFLALYGGPLGGSPGAGPGAWAMTMVALTLLGGGWSALALLPMIWHARTRHFGKLLAGALAAQGSLVWSLKLAVGRVRPWIALGLEAPLGSPHDGSFPSGHASGSFCVAAFIAVALPAAWPSSPRAARVSGVAALLLAALIALSRVYLGAHFPSDAIAGAAVGGILGGTAGSMYAPCATSRRRAASTAPAPGKGDDAVEHGAKKS